MGCIFTNGLSQMTSAVDNKGMLTRAPGPESGFESGSQSTCMHGRGGLSLDLNPVCLRVNATNLDQNLDQNPRVNRA